MSTINIFEKQKEILGTRIENNAGDWDSRKQLAHLLYNQGYTREAADLVWAAPQIPSIDLELAFAAKVLGKGRPSYAIRLLNAVQSNNRGKAVQNLALANALLSYGMVMQAARFYGAAIDLDPELVNPDLEHFLLWVDDTESLWGDFQDDLPKLEVLPWVKRSADEIARLNQTMHGHTTPISIPGLQQAAAEEAIHDLYVQSHRLEAVITPPPAVTIPLDRVNPKDILIDNDRGAEQPITAAQAAPVSAAMGVGLPQAPPPTARLVVGQAAYGQTVRSLQPVLAQAVPTPVPTGPIMQPTRTQLLSDGKISIRRSH